MPGISTELSQRIQALIDELEPDDSLGDWPRRVCKYELNALPVVANRIYLWALRADGIVLCMDHEALNHPTEPETNPIAHFAVLTHAARRYPALEAIVPAQPDGATACVSCDSTGVVASSCGADESCLTCGGLGWYAV